MAKLSKKGRYLVWLVILYVVTDLLLTPIGGLETRPVSEVTVVGITTLGLLFIGLALNIICLVLTLRRYKRSPIFGIIGSILFFPAMIADQTGQFSSLSPPAGITLVEVVESLFAVSIIVVGALMLREKTESSQ